MSRSSLRQQLVLPFICLVIFVSAGSSWVSFRAGESAIDELTTRVLIDMVNRIATSTEHQLEGASIALQSVAPDPQTVPTPQAFHDDMPALEEHMWAASGLYMELSNYVYFGGTDGRFVGINRVDKDNVELWLREPGATQRTVYAVLAPGDRSKVIKTDNFDPRTRPWYGIASAKTRPVWSPVYNDFTTKEPTLTLAKSVYRADKSLAGVLATDVSLKALSDFLRALQVSRNGVAFVIDGDGFMIATSGKELPFRIVKDTAQRNLADEMQTPLIREAYAKLLELKKNKVDLRTPVAREFNGQSGTVEMSAALVGDKYGVDWISVVAMPRDDFMAGLTRSIYQGVFFSGICVLIALAFGLSNLNRILRDIRALTTAVANVGNGEPIPKLDIARSDEIGQLAKTFNEMEYKLRVDKLTDVANRESLHAQVELLQRQAERNPVHRHSFALLFIDLDNFKAVNDERGHDVGDQVLIAVAARLKASIRSTDLVARYGGDEFVVLLREVAAPAEVRAAEEKILAVVGETIPTEAGHANVGVSVGWAIYPQDGVDTLTLLKVADSRMFESKKSRKAAR